MYQVNAELQPFSMSPIQSVTPTIQHKALKLYNNIKKHKYIKYKTLII